jgi:hypothetical protein
MTYQELAQQALNVQDACNLSGVAHAFSSAMDVLWAEARKRGEGTDWINHHPIVSLFIDKLESLNHGGNHNTVITAYQQVGEIADGKV